MSSDDGKWSNEVAAAPKGARCWLRLWHDDKHGLLASGVADGGGEFTDIRFGDTRWKAAPGYVVSHWKVASDDALQMPKL